MENFLQRRSKREHGNGILQKFVIPKGSSNSLLQVVWSPHVCLVRRRTNNNRLLDFKHSMYERAVTYEGPSHYSSEVFVAPSLERHVKAACKNIVDHFQRLHIRVQRMVLFFKTDTANNVWFIYASSVRIADRHRQSERVSSPLNLNPSFAAKELNEQMSTDISTLVAKQHSLNIIEEDNALGHEEMSFQCPNCGCSNRDKHRIPLGRIIQYFNARRSAIKSPRLSARNTPRVVFGESEEEALLSSRAPIISARGNSNPSEFDLSNQIEQYEEISTEDISSNGIKLEAEEQNISERSSRADGMDLSPAEILEDALDALEDIIYESYSHFMYSNTPYRFQLPEVVKTSFQEECDDILRTIGIWPCMKESDTHEIQHGPVVGRLQRNFDRMKKDMQKRIESLRNSAPPKSTASSRRSISRASAAKAFATIVSRENSRPMGISSLFTQRYDRLQQQQQQDGFMAQSSTLDNHEVPKLLRRIIPGITNASFRILCQETLFLTRNVEVCEKCFLQFTENAGTVASNVRRTQSAHAALRMRSQRSTPGTPKSPTTPRTPREMLPKIHIRISSASSLRFRNASPASNRSRALQNKNTRTMSAATPKRLTDKSTLSFFATESPKSISSDLYPF